MVGPEGSGKTTLALALFRILEPARGRILIDNIALTRLGLHDLRTKITYVTVVSVDNSTGAFPSFPNECFPQKILRVKWFQNVVLNHFLHLNGIVNFLSLVDPSWFN